MVYRILEKSNKNLINYLIKENKFHINSCTDNSKSVKTTSLFTTVPSIFGFLTIYFGITCSLSILLALNSYIYVLAEYQFNQYIKLSASSACLALISYCSLTLIRMIIFKFIEKNNIYNFTEFQIFNPLNWIIIIYWCCIYYPHKLLTHLRK